MREYRPWGWFELLERGDDFLVKKIHLEPGQRFSLQFHRHRTEHWIVIEGSGLITQGNCEVECQPGSTFTIGIEQRHRAKAHDQGLTFFEVQRGTCKERDIVRLEDDYGRTEKMPLLDLLI